MARKKVKIIDNKTIELNVVPGINDGGTMALAWVDPQTDQVVGRGLLSVMTDVFDFDQQSCIFEGHLVDDVLVPERVLISPQTRPYTDDGKRLYGLEDPTPLGPDHNFVEPGKKGLLVSEAFYIATKPLLLGTNILYYGLETGLEKTVLTPEQAGERGLYGFFTQIEMVKEVQVISRGGKLKVIMEVLADTTSRVVQASVVDGELDNFQLYLEPGTVPWGEHHFSTAANPLSVSEGMDLLLLNGLKDRDWAVSYALLDEDGHPVWLSPSSVMDVPQGLAPGPGGQNIIFASDARQQENQVHVLYHLQDLFCGRAVLEID